MIRHSRRLHRGFVEIRRACSRSRSTRRSILRRRSFGNSLVAFFVIVLVILISKLVIVVFVVPLRIVINFITIWLLSVPSRYSDQQVHHRHRQQCFETVLGPGVDPGFDQMSDPGSYLHWRKVVHWSFERQERPDQSDREPQWWSE